MKIDKAIELLTDHDNLTLVYKNPDLHASVKLGIEALRQLKELRLFGLNTAAPTLPGETP